MNKTFIAGAIGLAATGLIWLYGKFEKKKHEAKAEEVITIDEEGDVVDPRSEAEKIIDKPYEVWVSLDKEQQSKLLAAYVVIGLFSMTLCAVGSVSGYISAYKDIATEAQEIARKAQGDTVDALNLYRDAVDRSCFTQSIQCDYISDLEEALCHARGFKNMDDLYSYGDAMVYAQVEDGVLNEDALEDHHTYRDMYRDILLGKVKS